jgi:hypothetical protein
MGRLEEGAAALRRALEIITRLSEADPTRAEHRAYLAFSYAIYGDVLARRSDHVAALQVYQKSVDLYQALVKTSEMNLQNRFELATPCRGAGSSYVALARRAPARQAAEYCERARPYLECSAENYADVPRAGRVGRGRPLVPGPPDHRFLSPFSRIRRVSL